MSKISTGTIEKINDNGNGFFSLEVVTTPFFTNGYSEYVLDIDLIYDKKSGISFNVGDLVKFDEEDFDSIVKIPSVDFNYQELYALVEVAKKSNAEKIQELHQCIMGLTYKTGETIASADETFMDMLLNYDFGKASPVEMPAELIKFFNSEYVSNYYKVKLMDKIIKPYDLVIIDLTEEKGIKDLTGEEWDMLYKAIINSNDYHKKGQYFYRSFFPLAFQINSAGAKDFLNNYANPYDVIKRIVYTSGLNARPDYYLGRGTNLGDLNEKMLFSIFLKLERLDIDKSLAMAKLAYNMPTLGATEFLNSLYRLATNDYDLEKSGWTDNNIYLGDGDYKEAYTIMLASIASSLGRNIDRENYLTRKIKLDFIDLQNRFLADKYLVDEREVSTNNPAIESLKNRLYIVNRTN